MHFSILARIVLILGEEIIVNSSKTLSFDKTNSVGTLDATLTLNDGSLVSIVNTRSSLMLVEGQHDSTASIPKKSTSSTGTNSTVNSISANSTRPSNSSSSTSNTATTSQIRLTQKKGTTSSSASTTSSLNQKNDSTSTSTSTDPDSTHSNLAAVVTGYAVNVLFFSSEQRKRDIGKSDEYDTLVVARKLVRALVACDSACCLGVYPRLSPSEAS
ncbi:hypothetical protein EV356DRAFT_514818 [Viridothelium virens]|uniref:Uncharacterized protein n=1 Tax=Viridothelium virens TaxID=1048519 RepID=A0A6A6HAS9_VIRVR|nr:hypothetical protein EV356DRAFT_514818 [Viridothelium virens]